MNRPRKPSTLERRRLLTQIRKDCNPTIKFLQSLPVKHHADKNYYLKLYWSHIIKLNRSFRVLVKSYEKTRP